MPTASTFTNEIKTDNIIVYKGSLKKPQTIIKFSKVDKEKFVIWDDNVVTKWNGQYLKNKIAMKPYIDEIFNVDSRNSIYQIFDSRGFKFKDLITFKQFQKELQALRPRK